MDRLDLVRIGDEIACTYNGKMRRGFVVEIGNNWFKVEIGPNYRTFSWSGISSFRNLSRRDEI